MRKLMIISLVILAFGAVAIAQDAPKAEIFGGYQYFSVDGKGFGSRTGMNGWNADVAFNANKNLGIVADIGGAYKSESATAAGVTAEAKMRLYNYLFGPRFSYRTDKMTAFGEVLLGGGHVSTEGSATGIGGFSAGANGFAMAFGGGVDVSANKNFAIRLGKFDYVLNRFSQSGSSTNLNNFRFATGVVFKF